VAVEGLDVLYSVHFVASLVVDHPHGIAYDGSRQQLITERFK